jgi:16S rRNA (guanine966-N2)-methyltransferase
MRIVGGTLKGRKLTAPKGESTRPTSDRVREAVMSSLTDRLGPTLGGGVVLDLFAGSGALGLEALSRGATRAVFVERDRNAARCIDANATELGVRDCVTLITADALGGGLARAVAQGPFALLFCDPPYRIDQAAVARILASLGASGSVQNGAALAWEHAAGGSVPEPRGFAQERTYRYGDTAVTLLRYYGEDSSR